ncbi:MAG: insulinase family protein [Myxococcales bacterium]|nr:insulinase family protein [Myxococcales bacterium]
MRIASEAKVTHFNVTGLTEHLPLMLQALSAHLRRSKAHPSVIRRLTTAGQVQLRRASVRLDEAAEVAARRVLYGASHPASRGVTDASLGAISYENAQAFHERFHGARNAILLVAGAFDGGEVEQVVRETFSAWDAGPERPPPSVARVEGHAAHIMVIDPGAEQVTIRLVFPVADDVDPASPELVALLARKVARRIRERLGAAYSQSADVNEDAIGRQVEVIVHVDPACAGEALRSLRADLAELRKSEAVIAGLPLARRRLAERLLTGSMSSASLAGLLRWGIVARGRPEHAVDLYRDLQAVTDGAVAKAAARILDPSREIVIVRGPRESAVGALHSAGLDDFETVK